MWVTNTDFNHEMNYLRNEIRLLKDSFFKKDFDPVMIGEVFLCVGCFNQVTNNGYCRISLEVRHAFHAQRYRGGVLLDMQVSFHYSLNL